MTVCKQGGVIKGGGVVKAKQVAPVVLAENIILGTEGAPGALYKFSGGAFTALANQPPWAGPSGYTHALWGEPTNGGIIVEDFTSGDMLHYDAGTGLWTTRTAGFQTTYPASSIHGSAINSVWSSYCCNAVDAAKFWNGVSWTNSAQILVPRVFTVGPSNAWATMSSTFVGPLQWDGAVWNAAWFLAELALGYNVRGGSTAGTKDIHSPDGTNIFFSMRSVRSAAPTPGGFDLGGRVYRYNGSTYIDMGCIIATGQAFNMFVTNIFSTSPTDVWIAGYTVDIGQPPGLQNRNYIAKWVSGTTWTLQHSIGLGVVNFTDLLLYRPTLWGLSDGSLLVWMYTDNSNNGWVLYSTDSGSTWLGPVATPGGLPAAAIGTAWVP